MKTWKLALIAAIAGLVHGMTSSEPPFPHVQNAMVAVTRLPVSSWFRTTRLSGESAFERYVGALVNYAESRCAARSSERFLTRRGGNGSVAKTHPPNPSSIQKTGRAPVEKEVEFFSARFPVSGSTQENAPGRSEEQVVGSVAAIPNQDRQSGIVDGQMADGFLSLDVRDKSVPEVFEELEKSRGIEIIGKPFIPDKVISAQCDNMKPEEGIRRLMRIAGVENYSLGYRENTGGTCSVSQVAFFPALAKLSEDDDQARRPQRVASRRQVRVSDQRRDEWRTKPLDREHHRQMGRMAEQAAATGISGDLDGDGDVDRDDINVILAARNTPASGPDDPRDLDGDGMITALDDRKCVTMCTRPKCACE